MQYINYQESWQRGTADFPMEYHHVSPSHPQYVMSLHWHVEFELIRILKGTLHLTIDEEKFDASAGMFIFVPAGVLHEGIPDDCEYDCLVFDMNILMNKNDSCCRMIRRITEHEVEPQYIYPESDQELHRIIWGMFDAVASRRPGYQMIVLGSLYQMIGTIFAENHYHPAPEVYPRNHRRILQLKQVLEFIESSYKMPLTLEEISHSVNMSPKYFSKFFQEMTHRTPIDYLNYYRIERACYQLLTSEQSITEVAYNSGFNDLSYFIKTFKRYKGTTPKRYLKS